MRTISKRVLTAVVIAALTSAIGFAQAPAPASAPAPAAGVRSAGPVTSLKVQIVLSRYQGEKKISSLPYTLIVNANDGAILPDGRYRAFNVARLRTGAEVAVPSISIPKESPAQGPAGPVQPIQYKAIGTNIDCFAWSAEDARFHVDLSIEDSSVYADGQTAPGLAKLNDIPSFRSFQSKNTVILKDGQSTQFIAAADKISGEVTKIDVTISVLK